MTSTENLKANILSAYSRATSEERSNGMAWYDYAHKVALRIANGNLELGAAMLAVTSPMQKWERNVIVAEHAFTYGFPYPGMKSIMSKVIRLLEGEEPSTVVNGEKTTSFFNNIVNPNGSQVTIDRHAYDIAVGQIHTDKTRPSITKKMYAEFSEAYRAAADELGMVTLELQAVTWVAWRREKGIK